MVADLLLGCQEPLRVSLQEVEAAALLVGEELDREAGQPVRLLEPAQLSGRDMELVEPVRDVGVVLEVPGNARPAGTPAAKETSVVTRERAEQEVREPPRCVEPGVPPDATTRLS